MSIVLTITAKGQVTLRREVLEHLGLRAGDTIEVELLGPGRVELHRPPTGTIDGFLGCLPDRGVRASIADIDAAIGAGWARRP